MQGMRGFSSFVGGFYWQAVPRVFFGGLGPSSLGDDGGGLGGHVAGGRAMIEGVRLCVDCVVADANGTDAEGLDDWAGFLPCWAGSAFGPDPVTWREETGGPDPSFSWSPCDGCGSQLGGDRYDYMTVDL